MRVISVFLNDLRRLRKDIGLLIGLLVMPMAMIIPAILTYEIEEGEKDSGTPLVVVDYDGGEIADKYIQELDENFMIENRFSGDRLSEVGLQGDPRCSQVNPICDEAVGLARLDNGSLDAMLIIPDGLQEAFAA